jgi:hypothetical protein
MILEPKHKNFAGPSEIKETVKKYLISGVICQHEGLLNATTLR